MPVPAKKKPVSGIYGDRNLSFILVRSIYCFIICGSIRVSNPFFFFFVLTMVWLGYELPLQLAKLNLVIYSIRPLSSIVDIWIEWPNMFGDYVSSCMLYLLHFILVISVQRNKIDFTFNNVFLSELLCVMDQFVVVCLSYFDNGRQFPSLLVTVI